MSYLNFKRTAIIGLFASQLTACGGGASLPVELNSVVRVSLKGLQDLGTTQSFVGWLKLEDSSYLYLGKVGAGKDGAPTQVDFSVKKTDVSRAKEFVLTVESGTGPIAVPSNSHLLAGNFNAQRSEASISIDHSNALNTKFANASGRFFLATPVTAITTDEDQGLWFSDVKDGKLAVGLDLPTLPSGWIYEGWVEVGGKFYSTGRFTRFDAWDNDVAGPTAGPIGGAIPTFPGQDFMSPAVKLPGGKAIISVEPVARSGETPFFINPLVGSIANLIGGKNVQSMSNTFTSSATIPQGNVVVVAQ